MPTQIIAIRHAKPESEGYAEDALRPLSDEGRVVQRKVCQEMLESGVKIDRILHSPLLRAQQTAEIVAEIFNAPIAPEPALGNAFDGEKLLKSLPEGESIALVGHEPTLAGWVNEAVGETLLPYGLSKSGAAVISFGDQIEKGTATFITLYQP